MHSLRWENIAFLRMLAAAARVGSNSHADPGNRERMFVTTHEGVPRHKIRRPRGGVAEVPKVCPDSCRYAELDWQEQEGRLQRGVDA